MAQADEGMHAMLQTQADDLAVGTQVANRVHYTKPWITQREIDYATDAASQGWGSQCYEYIERFEQLFRGHLGTKHAIATSSCTGALHLGMAALGIEPGDEVIIANINWVASAAPITYLGATPVLVDVLPDTWCLDPRSVEDAITERTKAIVAVHLYGNLCEMDPLIQIGAKHQIPVIEDAAEAVGSVYRGARAGTIGKFGAFSFHGTKTITTGEGGMFVTDDDDLYERVLTLNNHGRARSQKKQFWPDMIGFKYKMSNIQAAIGCAQLERVVELVDRKREILHWYKRALQDLPGINMNPEPAHITHGAWMPTVIFPEHGKFSRPAFLADCESRGIDARVFFYPLSELGLFTNVRDCPVSMSLFERGVNLPSYFEITDSQLNEVATLVRQHWPQQS